ncbi:MAG: hypothetical protein Q4C87_06175 [Actinomycetaceae bacterium]|nr:hypothetical protein [Actinomycetaceae bacterium]
MSPQDDHEPEKSPAPPPRPLAPPMRRRSRRRGTRGYYRKRSASQVLKGSWIFRLFIVVVLVFAVIHWRYGHPSGPTEWIPWFRWFIQDSGFIFFSLVGGIFLIVIFVTGSHFKTAIQRLRAKGDDIHAIPVSYYVLWGAKVRSGSGENGRKSHWQWWRDWLIILFFPYGFLLTLFILVFLYYFFLEMAPLLLLTFMLRILGRFFLFQSSR